MLVDQSCSCAHGCLNEACKRGTGTLAYILYHFAAIGGTCGQVPGQLHPPFGCGGSHSGTYWMAKLPTWVSGRLWWGDISKQHWFVARLTLCANAGKMTRVSMRRHGWRTYSGRPSRAWLHATPTMCRELAAGSWTVAEIRVYTHAGKHGFVWNNMLMW